MESIPTNFTEAYKYVNNRYSFNDYAYPELAKLHGDARTVFSLKHILLHVCKHLPTLMDIEERLILNVGPSPQVKTKDEEALVKTVINMLTFLKAAEVPVEEAKLIVGDDKPTERPARTLAQRLTPIAARCEGFDHHNKPLDKKGLGFDIRVMWRKFQTDFSHKHQPMSIEDVYQLIPQYMKSK